MENHALDIIDMLYNMIAEAWGVPLGNDKCIVERDKALNLLDDLKATLPMELSEARRLVNARDEFVANAKQEADNIRRGAEDKATQMIDEQSVYQEAKRRSDEIVQRAAARGEQLSGRCPPPDGGGRCRVARKGPRGARAVPRRRCARAAGRHRGCHAAGCGGQRVHQRLSPPPERTKFS